MLRKVAGGILVPVSSFINNVLVGSGLGAADSDGKSSELAEHIYPLIYELHKISPGLLSRVVPNICVQLQVEDEDVRLRAVQLLGKLFASQYADYPTDFPRNFREFLCRFHDTSVLIRREVLRSCASIGEGKPAMNALMEGE